MKIYRFFKELDIDFDSHVTYDEFKNKLMPKEKSVEENVSTLKIKIT